MRCFIPALADAHVYIKRRLKRIRATHLFANQSSQFLTFAFGSGIQKAVCSHTAALAFERLDYDPKEAVGEIDGFHRSAVWRRTRDANFVVTQDLRACGRAWGVRGTAAFILQSHRQPT